MVSGLCTAIAITAIGLFYPAERASNLQAAFAPRAMNILKLADGAFVTTLTSLRQATATIETLGAEEFAKPRSDMINTLDSEIRASTGAVAFATIKLSTFGELSARLPELSQAYDVQINISGWDADRRVVNIPPFSRPNNNTPAAYFNHVPDGISKRVVGLDIFTEAARTEAALRSRALNTIAVTTPTSLSQTGRPSVQIYGPVFKPAAEARSGALKRASRCTEINETAHAFLGWTAIPTTVSTLISAQIDVEMETEHMRGVCEDVTDDPRFAWARAKLEHDNPCGERLALPQSTEAERHRDPNFGLSLGVFHHLRPECREGKTLFIAAALSDLGTPISTFADIEKHCILISQEVDRLRDQGLTVKEDATQFQATALHAGAVIQFAGRFWSITLTTTPRWFVLHPGPAFSLPFRIIVAALLGLGTVIALYSFIERQQVQQLTEQERQRAIRKRVAAANEAHSQTLSYVAHEVRNPAHVQLATAELMESYVQEAREEAEAATLEDPALDGLFEMLTKDAQTLRATSQVTVRLVSDLLDLTKLKNGKLSIVLRANPVSSLIAEAVERHGTMADPGVRVSFCVGVGVPQFLLSDGLRVAQILNNGLSNAAKFCSRGKITVCATLEWRYAPRSFFRQLTAKERRQKRRLERLATDSRSRGCGCFGSSEAQSNTKDAGRRAMRVQQSNDIQGDEVEHDNDEDSDDISSDPMGIIDVDGRGTDTDIVSRIPVPGSGAGADRAIASRHVHAGRKETALAAASVDATASRAVIAAAAGIQQTPVRHCIGDSTVVIYGDLPLNATAAPANDLNCRDPGKFETLAHISSSQHTKARRGSAEQRMAILVHSGKDADASVTPDQSSQNNAAATDKTTTTASPATANHARPPGSVHLAVDDAQIELHNPQVSTAAILRTLRTLSPCHARESRDSGQQSAEIAPTVGIGGPTILPMAEPAQGCSSNVVPADAASSDLGFHILRLRGGGKLYVSEPKVFASAASGSGFDSHSQLTGTTMDSDGVGRWLSSSPSTGCPLLPFQATDGRWVMPFVVFRVINTGSGLHGKTMQQLFAPYSSSADEDPGSTAARTRKSNSKITTNQGSSSAVGFAAASRSAAASRVVPPITGSTGDSSSAVPMPHATSGAEIAASSQEPVQTEPTESGGGFAARVRSTGLGLGIAARLAFSMGATIRLFDTESTVMDTVLHANGVVGQGAGRVMQEGLGNDSSSKPHSSIHGSSRRTSSVASCRSTVTVFEVAMPVCPPAILQRAQDAIPEEPAAEMGEGGSVSTRAVDSAGRGGSGHYSALVYQELQTLGTGASLATQSIGTVGFHPDTAGHTENSTIAPPSLGLVTRVSSSGSTTAPAVPSVSTTSSHNALDHPAHGHRANASAVLDRERCNRANGSLDAEASMVCSSSGGRPVPDGELGQPEPCTSEGRATTRADIPATPIPGPGGKLLPVTLERASEDAADLGTTRTHQINTAMDTQVGVAELHSAKVASIKSTEPRLRVAAGALRTSRRTEPTSRSKAERARRRDARKAARGSTHAVSSVSSMEAAGAESCVSEADTKVKSADAAAARPAKGHTTHAAKRRLPPMRILLVDDDTSVRDITARMLRRLGCSVDVLIDGHLVESHLRRAGDLPSADDALSASTDSIGAASIIASSIGFESTMPGRDAQSASASSRVMTYDCIFLDIVMPRLSGDVVARTLTSQHQFPTPLIACSGNAMPADLQRYRECGFSGVAAKPFSLSALKTKLLEVVKAKAVRAAGRALAAGKTVDNTVMSVLGPGPALSGLAETELFKQGVHHVLGESHEYRT